MKHIDHIILTVCMLAMPAVGAAQVDDSQKKSEIKLNSLDVIYEDDEFKGVTVDQKEPRGTETDLYQPPLVIMPLDEDDDANFLDVFVQDDQVQTDAAVEQESTSRAIRKSLDMLSEKERTILCMYFGLGTTREYTLEEIAMKIDISRERTRQIRDRALKRLKSEPDSPLYQMYMNQ